MPNYRGPRRNAETYNSLRDTGGAASFSELQLAYLGAFVAHILEREMSLYLSSVNGGSGLKVRVFNGDDKYEDTLYAGEDWGPVLDQYAKALGGQNEWRARAAKVHAATAQEASGATKQGRP